MQHDEEIDKMEYYEDKCSFPYKRIATSDSELMPIATLEYSCPVKFTNNVPVIKARRTREASHRTISKKRVLLKWELEIYFKKGF